VKLEGKVAVVTGGAAGIGRAIVEAYLAEGAQVVIIDRNGEQSDRTLAELAGRGPLEAIKLDVRDWAGVAAAFDDVADRLGSVDVCVNNAGVTAIAPSLEMTEQDWREVIDTNLTAVFSCSQAAARQMVANGGGAIINMSSSSAILGLDRRAPYCSSKGALISLTRVLAVEWAEVGIRVNAIGPGWVKTKFVQAAIDAGHLSEAGIRRRTPLDRLAQPAEIARVALFLATSDSSYVTGQTIFPDGGFTAYGSWS
jgi:NAD(P)-dependent dehydrogenase (short-subunit alcohol dehydrogenase family)